MTEIYLLTQPVAPELGRTTQEFRAFTSVSKAFVVGQGLFVRAGIVENTVLEKLVNCQLRDYAVNRLDLWENVQFYHIIDDVVVDSFTISKLTVE